MLQTLATDGAVLSGPHLMDVNPRNGDLFVALVSDTPKSTVLRYTRVR